MANIFTLDELSSLLKLLEESDVTEFEFEKDGEKLKLKRGAGGVTTIAQAGLNQSYYQQVPMQHEVMHTQSASTASRGAPVQQSLGISEQQDGRKQETTLSVIHGLKETSARPLHDVKSPMVGTFYRRPAPDAKPYVDVGDLVKEGDVLCIVEAMKLMNEIEADASGKIVEVCLDDSHMVEYGEVLFRIEPLAQ